MDDGVRPRLSLGLPDEGPVATLRRARVVRNGRPSGPEYALDRHLPALRPSAAGARPSGRRTPTWFESSNWVPLQSKPRLRARRGQEEPRGDFGLRLAGLDPCAHRDPRRRLRHVERPLTLQVAGLQATIPPVQHTVRALSLTALSSRTRALQRLGSTGAPRCAPLSARASCRRVAPPVPPEGAPTFLHQESDVFPKGV